MSLQSGLDALKQKSYQDAIQLLQAFCQNSGDPESADYLKAQMGLVKAYQGAGQLDNAIALCENLIQNKNSQVRTWAEQTRPFLKPSGQPQVTPTAGRAATVGVPLSIASFAGNLALASGVTISLLFSMVFVLGLSLVFISGNNNPATGLALAVAFTLLFNLAAFFLSPFLMDLIQHWLYKTRWVQLADIEIQSPETARVIRRVCQQKNLKIPKLGIIDDQNPTAFTYGSLPNSARLVVSQGLFTYLDDDEIATVYAHELGHIAVLSWVQYSSNNG